MTGSVTGIRRRRTVAGRRETSHLPPDRAFYGQTLLSRGNLKLFTKIYQRNCENVSVVDVADGYMIQLCHKK